MPKLKLRTLFILLSIYLCSFNDTTYNISTKIYKTTIILFHTNIYLKLKIWLNELSQRTKIFIIYKRGKQNRDENVEIDFERVIRVEIIIKELK